MSIYANLGRLTVKLAAIPGDGKPMDLKTPNSNLTPSYVKGREGLFVDRPGAAAAPKPVPSFSDMARDAPALRPATPRAAGAPGAPGAPQAAAAPAAPAGGGWRDTANWAAQTGINMAAAPVLGAGLTRAGLLSPAVPTLAAAPAWYTAAGAANLAKGAPRGLGAAYGAHVVGDLATTGYNLATGQENLKDHDYEQSQGTYLGNVGGNLWRPGRAIFQAGNALGGAVNNAYYGNSRARELRGQGLTGGLNAHRQDKINLQDRLLSGKITQQQYDQQLQRINAASQRLRNSWW